MSLHDRFEKFDPSTGWEWTDWTRFGACFLWALISWRCRLRTSSSARAFGVGIHFGGLEMGLQNSVWHRRIPTPKHISFDIFVHTVYHIHIVFERFWCFMIKESMPKMAKKPWKQKTTTLTSQLFNLHRAPAGENLRPWPHCLATFRSPPDGTQPKAAAPSVLLTLYDATRVPN